MLLALEVLGRRPELAVPVDGLGEWLRDGDAATVVVALLRWVALLGTGWLLGSTLLYLAASLSRVPGAVRAVRWSTLPAVRRAVDAACAVSVATSVVLAPTVAGAARTSDPPSVSLVRDGHGGGGINGLPADTTTTSTTTTTTRPGPPVTATAAPTVPVAPSPSPPPSAVPAEVVVAPGDNLWVLSARHLAAATGRAVGDVPDAEVAPYWASVCELNRHLLASGDPDLVFPGERVVFPATG
jgi:nucleoid-associated protein YgaU